MYFRDPMRLMLSCPVSWRSPIWYSASILNTGIISGILWGWCWAAPYFGGHPFDTQPLFWILVLFQGSSEAEVELPRIVEVTHLILSLNFSNWCISGILWGWGWAASYIVEVTHLILSLYFEYWYYFRDPLRLMLSCPVSWRSPICYSAWSVACSPLPSLFGFSG